MSKPTVAGLSNEITELKNKIEKGIEGLELLYKATQMTTENIASIS